jgi:N-carbamoyl-L-amino-acid hydrolase
MGVDRMGTMFARREGTEPGALPVYVGSHLDTQPTGGRYDGVLGVLAGLELVRSLNDLDIKTKHPIVVVNWTNEEGARFAPPMLASGVFAGVHSLDWAYDRTDPKGLRFGEELERIGWLGDEEVGARPMKAYFELHIEQGPILEAEGKEIGVVTHGQGLSWLGVTLTGRESHTGSTPMRMRRNAGLGMARITELVHTITMGNQPDAVGAIGHVEVYPNSRNIIPGRTVFTVDFRSPSLDVLNGMEVLLREGAERIAKELGLEVAIEEVGHSIRSPSTRAAWTPSGAPPSASATATGTSSPVPATTPAGQPQVPGRHGDVPLQGRPLAQRGRGDHTGMGEKGANVLLHAVIETAEIVA